MNYIIDKLATYDLNTKNLKISTILASTINNSILRIQEYTTVSEFEYIIDDLSSKIIYYSKESNNLSVIMVFKYLCTIKKQYIINKHIEPDLYN